MPARGAAISSGRASRALVLLLSTGAGAPAIAQTPAAPSPRDFLHDPVLRELVQEGLAVRPELRAAQARARAERERVPQVGALPDPSVLFGIQNDGFGSIQIGKMETSFWQVMLTQPVPWPGKLGLRTEVAELGARQAAESASRQQLTTEADVRRAYLDLLLARDRLLLLAEQEAIWQKSAAVARTRYEAGQAAQSDVLRAQLELNRLRQRRWALEADERVRLQALNRLRAHPLDEPIPTTASLRQIPAPPLPDLDVAVDDAEARSPELAAARLGADQASKQVALARRDRFPDFAVSAAIMPRGALLPMWAASVSVTLPIWAGRKQNRAVAESEARAQSGASDAEAVDQVLRLRVRERRTALAAVLETLRLYREGLLVQSQATVESALAQYQVGKVTFPSVLEANLGFVNDEDGYLGASADAQRIAIASAEVSLQPIVGLPSIAGGAAAIPGAGAMPAEGGSTVGAAAGGAPSGSATSSMPRM